MALGTAYQIYDDCLDLFGSEATVGKSLGSDLASGKLTLPILVVIENASLDDQSHLREMIQNWDSICFPRLLELLDRYDARNEASAILNDYLAKAREALLPLPPSEGRAALVYLTEFLARQTETLGPCN
jgi:octaprenyl-diphosphate synthase